MRLITVDLFSLFALLVICAQTPEIDSSTIDTHFVEKRALQDRHLPRHHRYVAAKKHKKQNRHRNHATSHAKHRGQVHKHKEPAHHKRPYHGFRGNSIRNFVKHPGHGHYPAHHNKAHPGGPLKQLPTHYGKPRFKNPVPIGILPPFVTPPGRPTIFPKFQYDPSFERKKHHPKSSTNKTKPAAQPPKPAPAEPSPSPPPDASTYGAYIY